MSSARINLKNIDYFKYKKLVIDGNRDDYGACSKEVRGLCDSVQMLNFRDDEFDDESDRGRFAEVITAYRQILCSRRIDALDMRIKSGWWGDHKNAYSAGKIKPQALKEMLLGKAKDWAHRHGDSPNHLKAMSTKIDGPGLFVFKHKDHQCFQYVGRAQKIFSKCGEKLKAAFEGSIMEPLAALLIISMVADWDFYFLPVGPEDDENVLRILENDLILKHDCIWPHGLNFRLHVDSLLEVSEFRKSCIRHSWPPDGDALDSVEINMEKLREQVQNADVDMMAVDLEPLKLKKNKDESQSAVEEKPEWVGPLKTDKKTNKPKANDRIASPGSRAVESKENILQDKKSEQPGTPTHGNSRKPPAPKTVINKNIATKKAPASPRKEATPIKSSMSNHSLGSDKSNEEQNVDTTTRTVTPLCNKSEASKLEAQTQPPEAPRKDATQIISDNASASADIAEEPKNIDSSTRPVTPTLDHDQVDNSRSEDLASQLSNALEAIQTETSETSDPVENLKIKKDESSKTFIASPRKTSSTTVKKVPK